MCWRNEFGFNVTKYPVHLHDLHEMLLHLLGFEHSKLAVKFQCLDICLTNVHGELLPNLRA